MLTVLTLLFAVPCMLPWYPVTTYTDGSAVRGSVVYRVWYEAKPGTGKFQEVAQTDGLMLSLPNCQAGNYYVSAIQTTTDVEESDKSTPLSKVQLTAPKAK